MFTAFGRINNVAKHYNHANKIMRDMTELSIVTHEYCIYHEERMIQQWHLKYESIAKALEEIEEGLHPELFLMAKSANSELKSLGPLFSQLQATYTKRKRLIEENKPQEDINIILFLEERLIANTLMRVQEITSEVFKFSDIIQKRMIRVQQRANLAVIFSMIGFGIIATCISLALVRQITERKQAEKELRASEKRFRMIYENAPVLIDAFDENGRCVLWNKECHRIFGWTIDEIKAHDDALSLFYPDPAVRNEVLKTVTTDPKGNFREWHPVTKDGKTLTTMWANFRLPDGMTFNLGYDITRLKKAEEQLEKHSLELENEVERRTKDLVETNQMLNSEIEGRKLLEKKLENLAKFPSENPNPVLRISKDGKILYANEASKLLLDKWKAEVGETVPQKWYNLITEAFVSEKGLKEEEEIQGKTFSITITPVKETGYANLYARDITERKKAENEARQHRDKLLHISRLSTVGEMASGLAHELNQPLCAILTHGNVCLRTCETGIKDIGKFRANLKVITAQSKRAGEIVNRIKDFVQKREPERSTVDINALIHETISFLESSIQKNNISLTLQLNDQMPKTLADPIQIEQVLINLITNALESMRGVTDRKHQLSIQTSSTSDTELEIAVSDTGEGFSETLDKLFEPFYTTKKDGLGIGLSISHSIIEAHGGTICAERNPDYGSTFRVTLPVVNINDKTTACEKES